MQVTNFELACKAHHASCETAKFALQNIMKAV